jgi:hypothetical protein
MPRKKAYRKCTVEECVGNQVAKGLCDLHYRRQLHHGRLEYAGKADWGTRISHPLYGHWNTLRRSGVLLDARWQNFWTFVADAGERPGDNFYIARYDESQPYGPENFFWREKHILKHYDESRKDYQRRYMREYRKQNPTRIQEIELQRRFGIGVEQYQSMLDSQGGVCAICKRSDNVIDRRTGKPRALAVDHCHRAGHVRKLLCQGCNQGLGNFRDSPELLRAAAAYLENRE